MAPDGQERRRDGWTMQREIIGTIIGVLPFLLPLIGWGVSVERDLAVHRIEITTLQKQRVEEAEIARAQRKEILELLNTIQSKIDNLQRDVARASR